MKLNAISYMVMSMSMPWIVTVDARCASQVNTADAKFQQHLASLNAEVIMPPNNVVIRYSKVVVPVYWSAFNNGTHGLISSSMINRQLELVNRVFASINITFQLKQVRYPRIKMPLFTRDLTYTNMKKDIRAGGMDALNVFSADFDDWLGYATFPWFTDTSTDGIDLHYQTMPGWNVYPPRFKAYNLGSTLVHEIGHWLGLWHTFQFGCTRIGNNVFDLPPQRDATSGCPVGKDTCPGDGPDPITNYMDYSDDSCYTGFSRGQVRQMRYSLTKYRTPK